MVFIHILDDIAELLNISLHFHRLLLLLFCLKGHRGDG